MLVVSFAIHQNINKTATVSIKIPELNRGKTDAGYILDAVFSKTDNEFYTIGTKRDYFKTFITKI